MSRDYKVGYKKPPTGSQFKKGQSGNPRGKQKGVRSLAVELAEELSERVWVTEDGKRKSYTKGRLLLKSLVAKGIKGDVRAAMAAIKLQLDHPQAVAPEVEDMSDADRAILADFLRRNSPKDASNEG